MSDKIAFIGIGNMGLPMAKNLMNAGKKVKVFDVSSESIDKAKNENKVNKIDNTDLELISGSLLEVSIIFNLRNSLGVPDTSVMMEGDKAFVYRVSTENVANKIEVQIGNRSEGKVEILSGLNEGDIIVAEGLRKVFPRAKINPIKENLCWFPFLRKAERIAIIKSSLLAAIIF